MTLVHLRQVQQIAQGQTSCSCSPDHRVTSPLLIDHKLKRGIREEDVQDEGTINVPRKRARGRQVLTTPQPSKSNITPSPSSANRQFRPNDVWASNKIHGRGLLRKAAILNLISRKRMHIARAKLAQNDIQPQAEAFMYSILLVRIQSAC